MGSGTSVVYGTTQLNNVKTVVFEQTSRRDDSGTDQMFWDFRIGVEAIVVGNSALGGGFKTDSTLGVFGEPIASDAQNVMRQALESSLKRDRQRLIYTTNDVVLLDVDGPDCDNGPRVQHLKITSFSPAALRVSFELVASAVGCDSPVLSNRWSSVDSVDDSHRTTRAWRGKLRVANNGFDPMFFREIVMPKIIRGWRRKSMNFTGEPNALELTYEIVDEEMIGESPPEFAIRWSGQHKESMSVIANRTTSEMSVRLEGGPKTDKTALLQQAMAVIDNRLHFANFLGIAEGKGTDVFESLTMTDYFGDSVCAVEVHALVRRYVESNPGLPGLQVGALVVGRLGAPFDFDGYDRYRPVLPSEYPSSVANLIACYLQTPCSGHEMPADLGIAPEGQYPGEDQPTATQVSYSPTQTPDIPFPTYSEEHKQGLYLFAECMSEYLIDGGVVQCPVAKPVNAAGPSAAILALASPTAMRRVVLQVERLNKPPIIYRAASFVDRNGILHVPKKSKFKLQPPVATGDSQLLYAADMEIVFLLDREPTLEEMSQGSLPWFDRQPENLADARDPDSL